MFNEYPYTNYHDLNLDWIIKQIKTLTGVVDDFVAYNKVTFMGTWTGTAYPAWTVVDDGNGNGFLSLKAVPAGVSLSDTEYWTQVASYATIYSAFNSRITALEASVTSLSGRMTTAEGNISNLQPRVTALEAAQPIIVHDVLLLDSAQTTQTVTLPQYIGYVMLGYMLNHRNVFINNEVMTEVRWAIPVGEFMITRSAAGLYAGQQVSLILAKLP